MISTVVVSGVAVAILLALMLGGAAALFTYISRTNALTNAPGKAMESRLASLEITVKGLPSLWEEERKRADRAADSARKARTAAEKILAEVGEVEDPGQGVPEFDGAGGEQLEMSYVRPGLASPIDPDFQNRVASVAHLLR